MKVSKTWLEELVELKVSVDELVALLPLRTIGTKEITADFIELDMKGYNRADLLSMRGVAREVAAITDSRILFEDPQEANFAWKKAQLPDIAVSVQDPQLCPIYCVAKITGLKVGQSTPDQIKKLSDCGIRSVNNIADITNLVMLEYGQPLHAFDASKVDGAKIIVRNASQDEEIITLDGKTRQLQSANLLIADSKKAIGIAGVMGGQNTEVTDTTDTILLEAAIFDPVSIRKTTISVGLPSEASKRFQHGLTPQRLLEALNSAIKMYQNLGGKLTAISLIGDFQTPTKIISLHLDKLNSLVGIDFSQTQVEKYLTRLNFTPKLAKENVWDVAVPFFRLDINLEVDLIEEVARMYGYEKIPSKPLPGEVVKQKANPIFEKISNLKNALVEAGLTEVQTYSFYSTDILNNLSWPKDHLVKIANPISTQTEYMRENIWPNLLEVANRNLRKGLKDVAIFEIGKVFSNINGKPVEEYRLAIALCNGSDNPLQELYGITQKLGLRLENTKLDKKFFHPNRQLGNLAEVHLRVLNKLGMEKRVATAELTL